MTREEVIAKSQQIYAAMHETEDLTEVCRLALELNRTAVEFNESLIPTASVEELLYLDKAAAEEIQTVKRLGSITPGFPAGYVKDFAEMWKSLRILIADEILKRNALARRR